MYSSIVSTLFRFSVGAEVVRFTAQRSCGTHWMVAVMVLWVTVITIPASDHRNGVNGGSLLISAIFKPLLHSVDRDIFCPIAIHMFCICHLVLLHELLHGSRECHHIAHVYSPFVIRPSLRHSWGSNYAGRVSTYQIRSCKQNKSVNRVYLNGFPTAHAAPGQRQRLEALLHHRQKSCPKSSLPLVSLSKVLFLVQHTQP